MPFFGLLGPATRVQQKHIVDRCRRELQERSDKALISANRANGGHPGQSGISARLSGRNAAARILQGCAKTAYAVGLRKV